MGANRLSWENTSARATGSWVTLFTAVPWMLSLFSDCASCPHTTRAQAAGRKQDSTGERSERIAAYARTGQSRAIWSERKNLCRSSKKLLQTLSIVAEWFTLLQFFSGLVRTCAKV